MSPVEIFAILTAVAVLGQMFFPVNPDIES